MSFFLFVVYYGSTVFLSVWAGSLLFKHNPQPLWGFVPIVMMAIFGIIMMLLWQIYQPDVERISFLNGLFLGSFLFVVTEFGFIVMWVRRRKQTKNPL